MEILNLDSPIDSTPSLVSKPLSVRIILFWVGLIIFIVWLLVQVKSVLLPFVLGLLIAYMFDHLCDRMQKYMPRSAAAGLVVVALIGLFVGIGFALYPLVTQQLGELVQMLPGMIANVKRQALRYVNHLPFSATQALPIDEVKEQIGNASGELADRMKDMVISLLHSGGTLLNIATLLLITPVVAFYCLRDWDKMIHSIDRVLPRAHAPVIRTQAKEINRTLAGFLRGQLNVCLIMGVYYAIGLTLAGLNFSLVIGFISGLLLIVPYAGAATSTIIGIAIALAQFDDVSKVFIVGAVYVSGQVIESYILSPKLVGDQVNLHPVWLIFGMLAGGALMGFTGVLIAVPLTAVIGVLIRFAIARYMHSVFYDPTMAERVPLLVPNEEEVSLILE